MARASATPAWQIALITLTSTVVGLVAVFVLYWAQSVCIPIALAVFFTFLLAPLVSLVNHHLHLGRVPSVLVVVLAAACVLGGIVWIVGSQAQSLAAEAPQYTENVTEKMKGLRRMTQGNATKGLEKMLDEVVAALMAPPDGANDGSRAKPSGDKAPAPVVVESSTSPWMIGLPAMAAKLVEDLTGLVLILVLVVFMLSGREDMRNRLIWLVGRGQITATTKALDEAGQRISHYLQMQLIVNGVFGLAISVGLLLIGVRYAFLWGFLGFLLRYIPYIGPWIAAAPPILLAVIMSTGWLQPLLVLGLFFTIEMIAGNVIEPRLYGRSIGVSEIAVLVAAAFWAFLWGPIGLVLSNPLTVCLLVLGKYVRRLQFLDVLLGDEPALAPDIAYYQRLLARDQKEAAEVVRKHANGFQLEQIYDDILAPAISYAARDRKRGDLGEEDEEFILQATREIMKDTAARHPAMNPSENGTAASIQKARVLACPARDEADRLALEMLCELLDPAKWEIEIVAVETLTSELLERVSRDQPRAVCIGSLPPGGLAHSRYLCKRLRRRFPELRILVGRWGLKEAVNPRRKQLQDAGADRIAGSLQETRQQLLSLRPMLISEPPRAVTTKC